MALEIDQFAIEDRCDLVDRVCKQDPPVKDRDLGVRLWHVFANPLNSTGHVLLLSPKARQQVGAPLLRQKSTVGPGLLPEAAARQGL